jgi:lipoprotein-anchoring transpeptidase ErfK/SrfK
MFLHRKAEIGSLSILIGILAWAGVIGTAAQAASGESASGPAITHGLPKAAPPPVPRASAEAGTERELPLVREDARVVINIPSRTLWVYHGDKIARYFPVGVGRVGFMTPMGRFQVLRKVEEPGWENPYRAKGAIRIAPGEENPLGTRWIGFHRQNGGEFGIHGTDNPGSVGKFSSHGCVRMKVPDAEALFDMIDVGTPIEVVYEPVLIRRQDNRIRVIVYADRFRRGMPTVEKVTADILKQYPGAIIDSVQLQTALRTPTERPQDVASWTPVATPPVAVTE